ncbi:synaptic vesicle transporter [Heterobasidion irregulare TC 32-1]|uniref:Synaptic vesicle transporter n=1 Tax=Heterobasidion irregulare (strain TC 32-1) TaxID=747525 RepID=W4K395_HETIT|nr:synaptic vesicle transporter [Heterobasidion irregulare TC 32-1]ETW80293.1 synaptic vesicle transporter [Heterobasidion irregulare TC 32-1]
MSLPHPHHEHEHNYEVALPAVLPDVDIEDAPPPPIHLARRSTRRSSMRQSISSPAARPHYLSSDSAETVTEPGAVEVAASGPGKLDPEKALEKWEVVDWEVGDPEDPRNFSKTKKWIITIAVSSLCLAVALGSAIITGDLPHPARELGMSDIVGNLAVTLFVVGFGLGPLVYAPMSEMFGRRPIYIISMGLFAIWTIPCALAKNPQTLLVGRALAGLAASAPMTNVGGSVADLWSLDERGMPMAVFSAVLFVGPVLGPLIGGFVGETIGWRWEYWILLIFVSAECIMTLFVPETFAVVLLKRRAEKLRAETGNPAYKTATEIVEADITIGERVQIALIRPFEMLFTEPVLIFMSLYLCLIYMLLYLFFFAFPIVFEGVHHMNDGITGLMFLSILVGILIALVTMHFWTQLYRKLYKAHAVEARLPPMMFGALMLPASLFIFAWTSFEYVSWVGPMMGGVAFGWGMVSVYISANSYIVDAFPKYVASAIAAKTFIRSMAGASVPMFVVQMYNGLGPRWASSLLGFVSIAMLPIPFVFWKWGAQIRAASRRASA